MISIFSLLLLVLLVVLAALLLLHLRRTSRVGNSLPGLDPLWEAIAQLETSLQREFSNSRTEAAVLQRELRQEITTLLQGATDSLREQIRSLTTSNDGTISRLRESLETRLTNFSVETSQKLESVRDGFSSASKGLQEDVRFELNTFRVQQERASEALTNCLAALGNKLDERLKTLETETARKLEGMKERLQESAKEMREDTAAALNSFNESVLQSATGMWNLQKQALDDVRTTLEQRLNSLQADTVHKLHQVQSQLDASSQGMRAETAKTLKGFNDSVVQTVIGLSDLQKKGLDDVRTTLDGRLTEIRTGNEKKLEQMRQTVEEKLQGTLETRLGESFKQVSDRLEQVHQGLGEMRTLATGVGDLKRIFTNVKVRGTWGEFQLASLLEQMLTPDQYASNVAVNGTGERVEYAIKLPGRDDSSDVLWLPIDAKFPMEDYRRLLEEVDKGDTEATEEAARHLETRLKKSAKDIHDKYIKPPKTTDFAILYLPTEGLYAEALRRPGLHEQLQRECRVMIAGPTTLAALLNSLQMGFRTLNIQKRSSEVWSILEKVKKQFGDFGEILSSVKKKLDEAGGKIEIAATKSRSIERSLRSIQTSGVSTLQTESALELNGSIGSTDHAIYDVA